MIEFAASFSVHWQRAPAGGASQRKTPARRHGSAMAGAAAFEIEGLS
jgi:hypothetical protein